MAEFIEKTDTLNEGREKINAAIQDAKDAKTIARQAENVSEQAKQIAQTAENKADNVQEQFNQVVIEGDSSVEAAQARVDADGNTFTTLKERLDTKETQFASQLAQTEEGLSFAKVKEVHTDLYGDNEPIIVDALEDGYLYGRISSTLYRKKKLSDPWELVKNLNAGDAITGIRLAGDGEVLVACASQGIWKSNGWSENPSTANFTQVLETNAPVRQFGFSVDSLSGWVLVTTYISSGDMSNSRYVWLSKDRGNTFEVVFDMADYEPNINQNHSHMHVALVDSYHSITTPRLWISYHKTNADPTESTEPVKRIKYSDDGGVTWNSFSDSKYQPVCAVALPNGVVFGEDIDDMGVYFVKRESDPSKMKYEWIYAIRDKAPGIFGWGTKAIVDDNGVAHIAFRTSVAGYAARVISTDGFRSAETLRIEPPSINDTVDLNEIVVFENKLLGTYYSGGRAYKFISDLPKRGVNVEGYETLNNALGGLASGGGVASGYGSIAGLKGTSVGHNSESSRDSVVIGFESKASDEGVSVGSNSQVTVNGVSIGYNSKANEGVTVGRNAESTGNGTSIGQTSKSINDSVAIGSFSSAEASQTTAIGRLAIASGINSVSVGALSQATSTGAIAIGRLAEATHEQSVVLGWGVQSTAPNQLRIGGKHIEIDNITNPSTHPINGVRLFSRKNANGKTELCVLFPSGSPIVIATEP